MTPSSTSTALGNAKDTTIKRRKGSRHDKTGCLTCRHRRKKCVENTYPTCGNCARLNLECVREPPLNIIPRAAGISASDLPQTVQSSSFTITSDAGASISPGSLSGMPPTDESQRRANSVQHRFAMRYYVNELANHFTVSTRFNSFVSDFLPMAMESPGLWDSLLFLAARHISLSNPAYAVVAMEAQQSAIRNLRSAIDSPSDDSSWYETNAATCLIFSTGLISTSNCKGWYAHMQGALHFIRSARVCTNTGKILHSTDALKTTAEGQWVLRNFAYHDILGCVTLRRRPLLEPDYLDDISNVVDSYLGVGTGLLKYIAQIEILNHDFEQRDGADNDLFDSFQSRWSQIEDDLYQWTCPAEEDRNLISMAHAYQSATLILLYRLVRSQLYVMQPRPGSDNAQITRETMADLLESKIAFQVSETLRHVSAIPVWAAPEASLVFPIFIVGGEAHEGGQVALIRMRLQQNLAKRNFQNISLALAVLERLWQRRLVPSSGSVDWGDILDESGQELVLT